MAFFQPHSLLIRIAADFFEKLFAVWVIAQAPTVFTKTKV
jgi:hypothetical protein